MRASTETRSRASRSEMSRTWSETRRSSGTDHEGCDAWNTLGEHDWARAGDAPSASAAASDRTARGARDDRPVTMRSILGASPNRWRPVKNRDVSLPLNAGTERESDDIENSVNRLTGKRCGQVKIRQR